jgi:hypothetical protein
MSAAPLSPEEVQHLRDWLSEAHPEVILFDGFDDAILGVVDRFGQEPVVLYDRARCIEVLQERDGMEYDEAEEFFEFNVAGCYAGETTPAFAILWSRVRELYT